MISPSTFTHSLFEEPWWLDLVAPGGWGEALVKSDGKTVARLPYSFAASKLSGRRLAMPLFSMSLGPWISPSSAKYAKSLSREKDLMTELIEQLPEFTEFAQNFHHSVTNWAPFYWKGFRQTTAYTYILEKLDDRDALWGGFLDNIRTDIRKAEKHLKVTTDLPVEALLRLNQLTFKRQGIKPYYRDEQLARIASGLKEKGMGEIFFCVDAQGRPHSAVLLAWDERSAYYLVGGSDPELRSGGSMSLVLWEAIQKAGLVSKEFNFHGSMLEPVERFFRAFGARQVSYSRVWRRQGVGRVRAAVKELLD